MERILIVEDDKFLAQGLCDVVRKKGYEAIRAEGIWEAEQMLVQKIDLILLDCNLPDGDGLSFCRKLREHHKVPIIFLTARETEQDMIAGFQAGADDYVVKPFSIGVLLQRIEAVLRRSGEREKDVFSYKGLQVDFLQCMVKREGRIINLSVTEYRLLELLIKNRGQVLTRRVLLEKVWDSESNFIEDNTLNVHIRRLRQKIEPDSSQPIYIHTVFGIGYTFGGDDVSV